MAEPSDIEPPSGVLGVSFNRALDSEKLSDDLRLELLEYQISMEELSMRKRASDMLLLGAISGALGFLFSFVIGVIRVHWLPIATRYNSYCETPINHDDLNPCYFPPTVSEMVHNSRDPCGKVFFCFEFVGALFIFFSWYPFRLRNVYIGDDATTKIGLSWVTCRQYLPAPGMMILSLITTVPMFEADTLDFFCIAMHGTGAMMMFVGYFIVEAVTIGWGPWKRLGVHAHANGYERSRRNCLTSLVSFFLIFILLQVVLSLVGFSDSPDNDEVKTTSGRTYVVKAATGWIRASKIASYAFEVLAGLSLVFSHLVIWYSCEERHIDLGEQLLNSKRKMTDPSRELQVELTSAS